ncbi:hypothetical protein CRENBAI_024782 [Crenichthys baileyi]|uniref:Uncharacterized protein n=1 Tax=Crenichthys baileyi TaxID=28760 RepID=A0AAV9REJ6_9TELE
MEEAKRLLPDDLEILTSPLLLEQMERDTAQSRESREDCPPLLPLLRLSPPAPLAARPVPRSLADAPTSSSRHRKHWCGAVSCLSTAEEEVPMPAAATAGLEGLMLADARAAAGIPVFPSPTGNFYRLSSAETADPRVVLQFSPRQVSSALLHSPSLPQPPPHTAEGVMGGPADTSAPVMGCLANTTEDLCDASAPAHATEGLCDASAPAPATEAHGDASAPAPGTEGLGEASITAHAAPASVSAVDKPDASERMEDTQCPVRGSKAFPGFKKRLVLVLAYESSDEGFEDEPLPDPVTEQFEDEPLHGPVPERFEEKLVLILVSELSKGFRGRTLCN